MEITWFGHSCFRLRDRDATVVTDPFDKSLGYPLPRVRADIVTVSHDHPHHNYPNAVKGEFKIVNSPGEYEIKSVFITGIATYPSQRRRKNAGDEDSRRNIILVFQFNGLSVCHLGDLAQVPTQTQVEALSNVDVLMVPVGGGMSLNAAQAAEVISLIEPHIVIPMHYTVPVRGVVPPVPGTGAVRGKTGASSPPRSRAVKLDKVDKFLKEMGVPRVEPVDVLKVTNSSLPEETQVVVLNPR
jgi:L-ascorbate metabolism protein UlaG (beta-lactamase superfamily)